MGEMRKFNLKEARKLSHNENMAIICDGLAEVAEQLATLSPSKINDRTLRGQADTFRKLANYARKTKGS